MPPLMGLARILAVLEDLKVSRTALKVPKKYIQAKVQIEKFCFLFSYAPHANPFSV